MEGAGKRRCWRIAAVVVLVTAATAAVKLRYYVLPHAFHVVEAGQLYRGGEQQAVPLRRIIRRYGIRTVICLVESHSREQQIVEDMGVTFRCFPMVDAVRIDGYAPVDAAAAILADPASRPVFFHCEHGRNRSNLVQAVYRMKYCGWTLDAALDELRPTGYNPDEDEGDRERGEFLSRYYAELILHRHASQATGRTVLRGPENAAATQRAGRTE
jgi:protein tyrosine phosphatase (PTP) superfamily phosphohydrolase (DUF442 family)